VLANPLKSIPIQKTPPCLRVLVESDLDQLKEVYRDAVITQAQPLYSSAQIGAWSNHAHRSHFLAKALIRGYGLASCNPTDAAVVEAFGLLDPIERLSLLYCRGRSCRQGRSGAILLGLENHAWQQGCRQWHTEASQLSKPLLLRMGWQIDHEERVIFAGEAFLRWRMIKSLNQPI